MPLDVSPLGLAVAIDRLERGPVLVTALAERFPDEQMRWKPAPEQWSLLEVLNHLADEEVSDFRDRIERTLRDPAEAWPSIDPQTWAKDRGYNERDPAESLQRCLAERRASIGWLRGLKGAKWGNEYMHPKAGAISARMLLANWIAHDLLHARQMLRLHHAWLGAQAAPDKLDYAGKW
ncbi:MAG TPA: DinB family protein [Planctomycetota bacterium]|nr:DinB family protein [Planctomycetota bacterium]